jgi:signal transduction histidine kinase
MPNSRNPLTSPGVRWWREGAVVAVAFVLCLLGGLLHADDTLAPPEAPVYFVAAVSSVMLLARHRLPKATMIATVVCGTLVAPLGSLPSPLIVAPAVISAYSLAARAERPVMVVVVVMLPSAVSLIALAPFFGPQVSWEDASRLATVAASPLVAAVIGRSVQDRRAYLAVVEERARRAEESRDREARRRVADERVRIARELHDLVAHQITLANAQATVAAHLFDTRPEQTRASLRELVGTTRQALDELRAAVGLLRQPDDTSVTTGPAPGLAQVPPLLESFRRVGLEVSAREDGIARPLPPAVDLTAYRVIQEALTNVTKHATTARAQVNLAWNRDHVIVSVTDDGSRARQERPPGYGLIGMRERATAVGGTLTAGVLPHGGFMVSARLPFPAAEHASRGTGQATDSAGR